MTPGAPGQAMERDFAYAVVDAETPMELSQRVSQLAAQGFLPCGGMTAAGGDPRIIGGMRFFQAMIRIIDRPAGPAPTEGPKLVT